jgi:hypothetical protein
MSKKITIGLFALLFVTSFFQTKAIMNLSDEARSQKSASEEVVAIEDFVMNDDLVSTVNYSIKKETDFAQYTKSKYPKDYQKRINVIDSELRTLLDKQGLSAGTEKSLFGRIYCWLTGGVYMEFNGLWMCLNIEVIDFEGGIHSDTQNENINKVGLYTALGFEALKSELKSITNGTPPVDEMRLKNWNVDYEDSLSNISREIEGIFLRQGINIDLEDPAGLPIWLQRFLCNLFGGEWTEFSAPYSSGYGTVTSTVQACISVPDL